VLRNAVRVHPSDRCTDRIGRGWLNRKISLFRAANTCALTSAALSLDPACGHLLNIVPQCKRLGQSCQAFAMPAASRPVQGSGVRRAIEPDKRSL
jgi:hypothetical protein